MMKMREMKKAVRGQATVDGAGVNLIRVLGLSTVKDFDPFLMLDAFDSRDPDDYIRGFPPHPHRGIETVTYLLQGSIDHQDSLGNKGSILDGDCQWMTAGSGIIHSEMPLAAPRMLGLQLWVNLPAKDKMATPKYNGLTAAEIPLVREDGVNVRILSGFYKGTAGAMQADYVPTEYLDLEMEAGAQVTLETKSGNTVFLYILEGGLSLTEGGSFLPKHEAVLLSDGEAVSLHAGAEGARLVFLSAPPLHETVAWGGPIVMNTEAELNHAFQELEEGTFVKHKPAL